jgi:hypothetical protein
MFFQTNDSGAGRPLLIPKSVSEDVSLFPFTRCRWVGFGMPMFSVHILATRQEFGLFDSKCLLFVRVQAIKIPQCRVDNRPAGAGGQWAGSVLRGLKPFPIESQKLTLILISLTGHPFALLLNVLQLMSDLQHPMGEGIDMLDKVFSDEDLSLQFFSFADWTR